MRSPTRNSPIVAGLGGLALAAGATLAFAAGPPATNQPLPDSVPYTRLTNSNVLGQDDAQNKFKALDADRNGAIDKHEAMASKELTVRFDTLDRNHDGKLSLTEFSAIRDLASIKLDNKDKDAYE